MHNPYRTLLLALLPALGCPLPEEKDSGDTDVTDTSTDTDTGATTLSEQGCYQLDAEATECPVPADVPVSDVIPATCGAEVISVDGAGTLDDGCGWIGGMAPATWCIYPITVIPPEEECDYGRPLIVDGACRMAPLVRRDGWTVPTRRGARGEAWARVGLAEHASIASFSRFALQLMALGAPADLVADAHAAALDEVRHAKLAFGLASAALGAPVGPGPLPLDGLSLQTDLVALAVATAREGCVAETLSALMVDEARTHTEHAGERAVLTTLARDESRHAALAWRTVAWAIEVGGDVVRTAVAEVFARPGTTGEMEGGLLPAEVAREVVARGWREVITPAAAALLGGAEAHASA